MHDVNYIRKLVNLFNFRVNEFSSRVKRFLRIVRFLSQGVDADFSRSSLGGIRQSIREVKETAILIKSTFCGGEFLGTSLVCPWSFVGIL